VKWLVAAANSDVPMWRYVVWLISDMPGLAARDLCDLGWSYCSRRKTGPGLDEDQKSGDMCADVGRWDDLSIGT